MIRRILIPLDISSHTTAALEWGIFVAHRTDATLTGMTVLDVPFSPRSSEDIPVDEGFLPDQLDEELREHAIGYARSVVQTFKSECELNGVAYEINEDHIYHSEQVIQESIYYDMVVMGLRTYYQFDNDDDQGDSLENFLDNSVTLTIGVPDHFTPPTGPFRVVICFDGSLQSARALQRFSRMFDLAEYRITVLISHDEERIARYHLKRVEAYLRAHGYQWIKSEWTTENIIEALRDKYLPSADMVVLGSHSRKGWFNFHLGSLSRYLIREENKLLVLGL